MADGTEGKRFYRTLPWWQVPPGGAPGEWVDARGNPVASTPAGPSRTTFSTPPVVRRGAGPSSVAVANPAKYGADPLAATTSPVPAWMRGDSLAASAGSRVSKRHNYKYARSYPLQSPPGDPRMSIGVDEPLGFDSAILGRLTSLTNAGESRQSAEDALFSELARQPISPSRGLSRATSPPQNISMPASMPDDGRVQVADKTTTTDGIAERAKQVDNWSAALNFWHSLERPESSDLTYRPVTFDPPGGAMPPLKTTSDTFSLDQFRVAPEYARGMQSFTEDKFRKLAESGRRDDAQRLLEMMRTYDSGSLANLHSFNRSFIEPKSDLRWSPWQFDKTPIEEYDPTRQLTDKRTGQRTFDQIDEGIRQWMTGPGGLNIQTMRVPTRSNPAMATPIKVENVPAEDLEKMTNESVQYDRNSKGDAVLLMREGQKANQNAVARELYKADQDRRFLLGDTRAFDNQGWFSGPSPREMMLQELTRDFAPDIMSRVLPMHIGLDRGLKLKGTPYGSDEASDMVKKVAESRGTTLPYGYLPGPHGAAIPHTWIEQQAARYGAFGPTARAKKLGFQGKERIPIEQLLNSDIGRSWFNHYMTSRPAGQ